MLSQLLLLSTEPPPPTTTGIIPTYAPNQLLYHATTDYHWGLFSENKTKTLGNWKPETGFGEGPFGFGKSVKLKPDECMVDSDWVKENDACAKNPRDCPDGLTFTVWEKNTFDSRSIGEDASKYPRKYLVSSGVSFNRDTGFAYPGFAIYRQGADLVGVISTGEMVWELVVKGQLYSGSWTSISLRWKKPNLEDETIPISMLGGLEMYVNGDNVGRTLLAVTENKSGSTKFKPLSFKIDGKDPPVVTLGCAWDYDNGEYGFFSGGEYDELSLWDRQLVKNGTLNELPFMTGGYSPDFADVSADAFNAMLGNVDLNSDNQAGLAQDVLEAMLLGPPTTTPGYPTRTADPLSLISASSTTKNPLATTSSSTSTTTASTSCQTKMKAQMSTQGALTSMLKSECTQSRTPEDAEKRFALAKVAAKILSGEEDNAERWRCVEELNPNEEGAPKVLRQIEDYMLSFVGCVNISVDNSNSPYFNKKRGTMNFKTFGDDFVMNVDKMDATQLRKGIRLTYPNYNAAEWVENKAKWENPKDTYSVPTGMFKDIPGCNDKPVTVSATILNGYGAAAPLRKNPTYIRAKDWKIDSKVISTKAQVNPDPITNNIEEVLDCSPDERYLQDNPIRATLYHKHPGRARIDRRILWHTDMERLGIEVRQCAWWNEGYSYNGAWDPAPCTLVETDAEKTTCECSKFGAMAVIVEMSEKFEVNDKCSFEEIVKYIGIAVTTIILVAFMVLVTIKSNINDMFHSIRNHVCLTWILGLVLHICSDLATVRADSHINLLVGCIMIYFYTSSLTWMACEAHAIFKAITAGIISGRGKVYLPFGYGTPVGIIGCLFLFFADDLGTDPRCFISWENLPKEIYFYYNFVVSLINVILALIILFNLARPQTKRKNVVEDLKSQGRGTALVCFASMILWLFAYFTYMRNPESDAPSTYCIFIMVLGWFGTGIIFVGYGLMSKRFRKGVRGEKTEAKYAIQSNSKKTSSVVTESSRRTSTTSATSKITTAESIKASESPLPLDEEQPPIIDDEPMPQHAEAEDEILTDEPTLEETTET